ncbi:hypothetical protein BJV78DRAFT_395251 [Lactifluus subvellereus]|nr:hypothetical protein BJV78DRAFT_395251 [Lactifluus subvellereus]
MQNPQPPMPHSSPPDYGELDHHPNFCFSDKLVTFQVDRTLFKVHEHFLFTYSSVFRRILRLQHQNDNNRDDNTTIYLDGVSVLEFESLLTFFYESWQESFSMSTENWVALLAIAHRFKFTDAEFRARREIFQRNPPLDPVKQISIAEKYSVPISFIVPALESLVRRPEPLLRTELVQMSSEMVASLGVARERYVGESLGVVNELGLKLAVNNIVRSVWPTTRNNLNPSEPCKLQ